jgi:hypothetical protein
MRYKHLILRVGNNPSFFQQSAQGSSHPTMIISPNQSFYNTNVTIDAATWTESNHFLQLMWTIKNNQQIGITAFKEKTYAKPNGIGIEAPGPIQFSYLKEIHPNKSDADAKDYKTQNNFSFTSHI